VHSPLSAPVARFRSAVEPLLVAVGDQVEAGVPHHRLRDDVAVEASELVGAVLAADSRLTDEELWAYIACFGPLFDTNLRRATPDAVRKSGVLDGGKARWLDRPSPLLEVLVEADRRAGTRSARAYYDAAMELAHVVVALDAFPSSAELDALERYRSMLLQAIGPAPAAADGPESVAATAPGGAAETDEPLPAPRPIEELLAELDSLVGLEPVKAEVRLVTALLRVSALRRQHELPVAESSRHLVFTGNPGTGKTTVARLLAEIYRTLGVVEKGHLVETDRSQLVAGFVGQTAIRVRETFDRADQGVLLVDEAYALVRGSETDFGREAVDTLVKLIEDRRDSIVVIVAGYPEEMEDFVGANPGLRSRFPKTIHFPDYTDAELAAIFASMAQRHAYRLTAGSKRRVGDFFAAQDRSKGFGNARLARNLFEGAIARQLQRLFSDPDVTPDATALWTLTAADSPKP